MFKAYVAVVLGIGLGGLVCAFGQKHLNQIATNNCKVQTENHQLITIKSWVGSAKHCLNTNYLN